MKKGNKMNIKDAWKAADEKERKEVIRSTIDWIICWATVLFGYLCGIANAISGGLLMGGLVFFLNAYAMVQRIIENYQHPDLKEARQNIQRLREGYDL